MLPHRFQPRRAGASGPGSGALFSAYFGKERCLRTGGAALPGEERGFPAARGAAGSRGGAGDALRQGMALTFQDALGQEAGRADVPLVDGFALQACLLPRQPFLVLRERWDGAVRPGAARPVPFRRVPSRVPSPRWPAAVGAPPGRP